MSRFSDRDSSLAVLRQFPVDCIKDRPEITKVIITSPESKALIGTLVQLGKVLGLSALAEGVETTGELDILRHEHVNEAQGSKQQPAVVRDHHFPFRRIENVFLQTNWAFARSVISILTVSGRDDWVLLTGMSADRLSRSSSVCRKAHHVS